MDKLITDVEQDEIEQELNRGTLDFSIIDQNTGKAISTFLKKP